MLSDDKLWDLWNAQGTDDMSKAETFVFARAVEAEVRKQDTELIRQMLDALNLFYRCTTDKKVDPHVLGIATQAITAAKTRLEDK